jgi:hypothetical protein
MATAKKTKKKEELIPLDENILMISEELLKHITPINIDIKQHINKKTIIVEEKLLNEYLSVNIKLSQIKDLKKVYMSVLDNDILEIELNIEKFDSKANIKKQIKISEVLLNKDNALFKYSFEDTYNTKGNDIITKIILLFTKYIIKQSFNVEIIKKFTEEKINQNNELIEIDLKDSSMNILYHKTVNEVLNTSVPFFGHKKIPELFQIESIMCEKGQIWIDYVFNII